MAGVTGSDLPLRNRTLWGKEGSGVSDKQRKFQVEAERSNSVFQREAASLLLQLKNNKTEFDTKMVPASSLEGVLPPLMIVDAESNSTA
jgi:hypothetical protein